MNALPSLPCLCANLRRATRVLTQSYEEALRPSGLRSSQFTILQALSLTGEVTQGHLGRILAMDSTTLTRTLTIMSRHRWITRRRGHDRREWLISLSKAGKARFEEAKPAWEKAQTLARRQIGESRFDQLMTLANHVANAVTAKGDNL